MRHTPFTAVYDACVLYPAPIPDLLIRLAGKGLYRAKWTAQDEFIMDLWDLDHAAVLSAAAEMRRALTQSRFTPEAFIDCLFKQGLPQTTNVLKEYKALL